MRKYWTWKDVHGDFQLTVDERRALAVVAEGIKVLELSMDIGSQHNSVLFATLERTVTFNRKALHIDKDAL